MNSTHFPHEWEACSYCTVPVPSDVTYCPHCGQPQWFPNVNAVSKADRRAALQQSYNNAVQTIAAQGDDVARQRFEVQCDASKA
ncbi:MAG: hypothetical protein ACKOJF_23870, partial [Planctomycetaceae bacterium]